LVHNQQLTNNKSLLPDAITYTAVMKTYVNQPRGGEKALAVLSEMNDQCINGNHKAKPDVRALAVAMDACAKSGLTSEAERILNDVPDLKKSEVLFNTVISGYKSEGRGLEAEAVLRRMISLDNAGLHRCAPDSISYSLCIMAVSR
jgi:pentatricopeptide repeat protein